MTSVEQRTATVLLVTLLVVFASCLTVHRDPVHKMSIAELKRPYIKDSGHVIGCDGGQAALNLTWTPKNLKPTGEATVFLDYVFPYPLSHGFAKASVYYQGDPDPTVAVSDAFTCEQLQMYAPNLTCPITKGTHLKLEKTFTNLHKLTRDSGSTYSILLQALNDDKQELFCINATAHIDEI